jgi:hypothetical protein
LSPTPVANKTTISTIWMLMKNSKTYTQKRGRGKEINKKERKTAQIITINHCYNGFLTIKKNPQFILRTNDCGRVRVRVRVQS